MRGMKRRAFFFAGAIILIALGAGGYGYFSANGQKTAYKFAKVEKGDLTASVAAAGTLSPVSAVQVGSQISGQIKEILVDFNSPVKAGQLVARIDPETYQYKLRQAEADLEATRSAVNVQNAQRYQAQVNLADARRDYERKDALLQKHFISSADRDKALTVFEAAGAQLKLMEAQVKNSESVVAQREAQVAQARIDLGRTEIRSPVNGVVVKRSIEPGQTVAASLQAPELFIIARDLADMQVETSIDEADVGRVQVGQQASFTVDAFPNRHFQGEVRQVRKAATVVSNVVTYTVIVSAANPDMTLLPGMTANVRIATAQKDGVLKVGNAALRFKPDSEKEAAKVSRGDTPAAERGKPRAKPPSRLWVVGTDGKPQLIEVQTGITDGSSTEVNGNGLTEGMAVIVGYAAPAKSGGLGGPRMF